MLWSNDHTLVTVLSNVHFHHIILRKWTCYTRGDSVGPFSWPNVSKRIKTFYKKEIIFSTDELKN